MIEATVARVMVRSLNRWSGMTGSAATRASTYSAAATRARPPPIISAVVPETQSKFVPASDTQTRITLTPATIRVAPR
jgi:hypothetical protein